MPIHIRAERGDYAPAVLVPGDPVRARYIAETCFDPGARCVNQERGMLGFTGTFEGRPISVQAAGMGCASAAIYYNELIDLGATRLIRVGTAGGLRAGAQMGDTLVAVSATPDDLNVALLTDHQPHAPTATYELVEAAVRLSREQGTRTHIGPVVSSGTFYDPRQGMMKRWKERGHIGVEMEAAVLYTIGALRHIETLAIMTVSDLFEDDGTASRISDEELKAGVDRMTRVACRVATGD